MCLRIKELRTAKGKSQTDMALDLGTSQPSISRIEDDEQNVSLDFLRQMANYFGVHITELFVPPEKPASVEKIADFALRLSEEQRRALVTYLEAMAPPDPDEQDTE